MSPIRRVILLLSVAVLLREGSSNSPLGFLRDLKNRIFPSSNTTELAEESSAQCSGTDQEGVCVLKTTTTNGTSNENDQKTLDNSEFFNGTKVDSQETEQNEEYYNTNNTQYYDQQEWNSTASNNTDNYSSDFEYPESEQNGTNSIGAVTTFEGDETNNLEEKTRKKRHVSKLEINIAMKTPKNLPTKPLTISKIVFTGKSENFTVNLPLSQFNNASEVNQDILKAIENNTSTIQNVLIPQVYSQPTDENKTVLKKIIIGNETIESINNEEKHINESTNTTLYSAEDQVVSFNGTTSDSSESPTEENYRNEQLIRNCTDCVVGGDLGANNSMILDFVGPKSVNDEHTDIVETVVRNNYTTIRPKLGLKHILANSTWIFKKIVQDVAPMIHPGGQEEEGNESNSTIDSEKDLKITEDQFDLLETIEAYKTKTNISDKIGDGQLNFPTNTSGENNTNLNVKTSIAAVNITLVNSTEFASLNKNLNNSMVIINTVANNVVATDANTNNLLENSTSVKRERRSINLTFLTDDEEQDVSKSTFPDPDENPALDLTSSIDFNSTDLSLTNTTEDTEAVGPTCTRRYDQCSNSTDCCEGYECVEEEGNNSTSHCDLRPANLTLPMALPIAAT